jgi:hypothetical protein
MFDRLKNRKAIIRLECMAALINLGVHPMICDICNENIEEGEYRALRGQTLCEDCYIDALSPAKACDPWAVYCAKSFSKVDGCNSELTETQAKLLQILKDTGGVEQELLLERIQIKASDLEREIATLRHMEKLKATLQDGKKIFCLW